MLSCIAAVCSDRFLASQVLPGALPMFGITSELNLGRLQGAGGADIIPSPSLPLHHPLTVTPSPSPRFRELLQEPCGQKTQSLRWQPTAHSRLKVYFSTTQPILFISYIIFIFPVPSNPCGLSCRFRGQLSAQAGRFLDWSQLSAEVSPWSLCPPKMREQSGLELAIITMTKFCNAMPEP